MLTAMVVELKSGFTFRVEHEVKTVTDMQRLIAKADAKIAAAKKAIPEIADEVIARVRVGPVREPAAAAAAAAKE